MKELRKVEGEIGQRRSIGPVVDALVLRQATVAARMKRKKAERGGTYTEIDILRGHELHKGLTEVGETYSVKGRKLGYCLHRRCKIDAGGRFFESSQEISKT